MRKTINQTTILQMIFSSIIFLPFVAFLGSPTTLLGQTVTVYEETFDSPWNAGDWDQYTPEEGSWATEMTPFICQGDQAVSFWDSWEPVNGWIISDLISLQAGITYTCSFYQRVGNSSYPENMGTYIYQGNGADFTPGTATTVIWRGDDLTNENCQVRSNTFTLPSDGNYNIVFHCTSAADEFLAIWDDIKITRPTTPAITFINGANAGLNFVQTDAVPPEDNWLLGQFSLVGDATGATLNSVTVTLGGSYSSSDFGTNPFSLYASETDDFETASSISGNVAYAGSGSDITFSGLSDAIPLGTRYYWVTADIAVAAEYDDTINGTIDAASNLTITGGTLSGSSSYGKLNAGTDASLPVELSSFSAEATEQGVVLRWVTASELDNLGFILERQSEGASEWLKIASYETNSTLRGQGNTSQTTSYSFMDKNVQTEGTYNYSLSDVSTDGEIHVYDVIQITMQYAAAPGETLLEPAFPNPFNPQTKISYQLAESGIVEISVYDMLGRKVSMLLNENQNAGSYNIYWYGRDNAGQQVSTGTYILRMSTGEMVQTQKVLLMR